VAVLVIGGSIAQDAERLISLGKGSPQLTLDDCIHHERKTHDKVQGLNTAGCLEIDRDEPCKVKKVLLYSNDIYPSAEDVFVAYSSILWS